MAFLNIYNRLRFKPACLHKQLRFLADCSTRPSYAIDCGRQCIHQFVQFFDGVVAHVRATPSAGRLELGWESLLRIDVTTLDSLRQTLRDALELLEAGGFGAQRDEARTALRLIECGG